MWLTVHHGREGMAAGGGGGWSYRILSEQARRDSAGAQLDFPFYSVQRLRSRVGAINIQGVQYHLS